MNSKIILKQSTISALILGIFFFIGILLAASILFMNSSIQAEQTAEMRRTEFKQLGINLADASDYLTDEARKYAVTNDIIHLEKYWEEINKTQTRDNVISRVRELNSPGEELALLAEAKRYSDALVSTERRSMRLVLEAQGVPEENMVNEVSAYHLSIGDQKLNNAEKLAKAREIMFDAKYDADKKNIMDPIAKFQTIMNDRLEAELAIARKATTRSAILQMILAVIIIGAIAVLIRLLFKQVTYPINNYTQQLLVFSFSSESFSLIPEGTQELRMLATNFNELYNSFQEELIKRRLAEDTMKAAKEEAELANNAKSEFLANMSHEIRTPLNTITGYEYLLNNTELEAKQKEYVEKIGMAANNLLAIINEILDFSKIEAGRMNLETIEFDLHRTLKDLCSMVSIGAQQKGLVINYDIKDGVPQYLIGDTTRLNQVILNLLSNAIKFTHRGSIHVLVELLENEETQTVLRFSVSDTGIGIAEKNKEAIFEVFTQENASTSRKYGGTGLGLAICKKIVGLMDGEIFVESEEGKGSVFSFTAKFEIAKNVAIAIHSGIIPNALTGIFKQKRILIVEDNLINLQMAREMLESMGFDTHVAESGFAAVKMVEENRYDAVLMDIRMPVMDGYEATRRIRLMEGTESLPIIALSADAVEGVAERAKESGMNSCLTKPLNPIRLVEVLKEFITIQDIHEIFNKRIEDDSNSKSWVEFERGIQRIGGNREKYKNILEQFIANHCEDSERIKVSLSSGNFEEAKMLVHTIKGIAGNIEANYLKAASERLEKAIFDKANKELIFSIKDFDIALRESCNYSAIFILTLVDQDKTEIVSSETGSSEYLFRLLDLLNKGDPEAKSFFESSSYYFENNLDDHEYRHLKMKIFSYDLEEAANDLQKIIDRIRPVEGVVKHV